MYIPTRYVFVAAALASSSLYRLPSQFIIIIYIEATLIIKLMKRDTTTMTIKHACVTCACVCVCGLATCTADDMPFSKLTTTFVQN